MKFLSTFMLLFFAVSSHAEIQHRSFFKNQQCVSNLVVNGVKHMHCYNYKKKKKKYGLVQQVGGSWSNKPKWAVKQRLTLVNAAS